MPGQSGGKTTRPDVSFRAAVGRRIKEERERKQIGQELVALIGRRWGLAWSANTVAQLETGRRRLMAEEWILLPVVLTEALNPSQPYTFKDLIPDLRTTPIALTPEIRCYSKYLGSLLENGGQLTYEDAKYFDRPHSRRQQALPGRQGRWKTALPSDSDFTATDYKAALVLGVPPTAVVTAALRLWNRSLMEERDHRLTETGQTALNSRKAQALKGHLTRKLLQELGPVLVKLGLKPTAKKKITKGGLT